jgi:ribosome biogenesis SPOUT family RNA methylase Rps3
MIMIARAKCAGQSEWVQFEYKHYIRSESEHFSIFVETAVLILVGDPSIAALIRDYQLQRDVLWWCRYK